MRNTCNYNDDNNNNNNNNNNSNNNNSNNNNNNNNIHTSLLVFPNRAFQNQITELIHTPNKN